MKKFSNKTTLGDCTTNFTEARYWYHPHKDSYVYRSRLVSRIYRLGKSILKDFKFTFSSKKSKNSFFEENDKELVNLIKTWVERLNNNGFHGGDVPDAADFKLYAIIRKYLICRSINFKFRNFYNGNHKLIRVGGVNDKNNKNDLIDHLFFIKFDDWVSKMSLLCSRSSFYNIRDVGYNYNKYMSEDVLEDSRINKPQKIYESESDNKDLREDFNFDTLNDKKVIKPKNSIMGVFGNKNKRSKVNF